MASYYPDYIPQSTDQKPTSKKKGLFDAVVSNLQGVGVVVSIHS